MDIIRRLGRATAADVHAELAAPPSYSAVRATLAILEKKGHLTHRQDGPRYVYRPTRSLEADQRGAVRHLLRTFFDDSPDEALAMLLDVKRESLSPDALARMEALLAEAREEGR
jgi:predicted transcriptional regulator